MTLLDNVKALCDERKITINRLEKEAGVTRGSIAKWENTSPGIDKIVKVANYFGVSIYRLLDGTEYKKPADLIDGGLDELNAEVLEIFSTLPDDRKEIVLAQLRGLAQLPTTPGDPPKFS